MPAQIVTFTFPHIGNVGVNDEDVETVDFGRVLGARGVIVQAPVPRSVQFPQPREASIPWLKRGASSDSPGHRHPRPDPP